jgi:hypothetical protein
MKRWLQQFSFKKSPYERPNQKWVCGHACTGEGCLIGPDAHGTCRATTECRPLRKGDRWHCTRAAAQGGPCPDGPLPDGSCCHPITRCIPSRSLRSWRGLVSVTAFALSLALVLFVFGSKRRGNNFVSPGPLSFGHASSQSKCSDCHSGLDGPPVAWLTGTDHVATHGRLCLDCHDVGGAPFSPHSLPEEQLQRLTAAVAAMKPPGQSSARLALASLGNRQHDSSRQQMDCSLCHKEHQGAGHDLRTITDQQCQTCHSVRFAGFASGHPPFPRESFTRRTRIVFDHVSHLRHHFTDPVSAAAAPSSCTHCHEPDLRGERMVVKPYETTCAPCHDDQVKGKGAVKTGFTFIGLPRFDDRTLVGTFGIGEWPEDAEQPVTPFLRLLLASDPKALKAMETLGDTDLSDIAKTETEKLAAAQTLAWSIKGLVFDLVHLGHDALVERTTKAIGRPLTSHEQESITALLTAEAVRNAFGYGFPHLQDEVVAYRTKNEMAETEPTPSPPLPKKSAVKPLPPDVRVNAGGWYSPEASFALMYRPRGHADRFLTDWMNLTVATNSTEHPAIADALFAEVSGAKAPGYCAKCHSIDSTPTFTVNWTGDRPNRMEHGFNRFVHSSHLSLVKDQGCQTCHSLKDDADPAAFASAYAEGQRDAFITHGNFGGIKQETCASCHQPAFVAANCTTCHNYHVGRFQPSVFTSAKMDGLGKRAPAK